jgi:hypothetical protein
MRLDLLKDYPRLPHEGPQLLGSLNGFTGILGAPATIRTSDLGERPKKDPGCRNLEGLTSI